MKKVGFISDIHGRTIWKKFIEDDTVDEWVFLGDYVDDDHQELTDEDMVNNLKDIIQFKKDNMDKVTLLIGNHDNSYILGNEYRCSRFRRSVASEILKIFTDNKDLFCNAWQYKNVIATHAGISNEWFNNSFKGELNSEKNIAEQLNNPINIKQMMTLYDIGYRRGGNQTIGGIFWLDVSELSQPLVGYKQVVGHNRVKAISKYDKENFGLVYLCDCLGYTEDFLKLNI